MVALSSTPTRSPRRLRPRAAASASLDRPLPITRRRDLTAVEHRHLGVRYWVVKDPLGLKYYRFPEEEYGLLQMLDGRVSMRDLMQRFHDRYAPRRIDANTLQKFIGRLHERGLVIVDMPGQADVLLKRERAIKRQAVSASLMSLLAIRFPGVDPERTLTWLNRWFGWVFSPLAAFVFAVIGLAALMLLATNFQELMLRMPSLSAFFAANNLVPFAAAMIFCKICHEFGHGLSAKVFGGECHRMGFMLLVFMPAMYCDVSDSWLLPSKWRRIVIDAAGVYIELILASFATFVWWFSQPGMLNSLALGVMVSSSISTLLVNANPLMRFDGYYALSDWLEIPNLASRSRQELQNLFFKYCCGLNPTSRDAASPRTRAWLIGYGVASQVYRVVLVAIISLALHAWLAPIGLGVIADGLLVLSLFALFVMPAMSYVNFFRMPGRIRSMKAKRVGITAAVLAAAAAFVGFVPLPHYVRCDVLLDVSDTQIVYADPGGRVEELLAGPGDRVESGQPILRLSNLDLDLEIARLETQRREAAAVLDGMSRTQFVSPEIAHEIGSTRDKISRFDDQLEHRRRQRSQLTVRAPKAGWVISIPNATRSQRDGRSAMIRRRRTVLDDRNLGGAVGAEEWICQIGNPSSLKATLLLDQSDSGDVRGGQPVLLRMHSLATGTIETRIDDVASEGESSSPAQGGPEWDVQLTAQPDQGGIAGTPGMVAFRATAHVDNSEGLFRPGMLGRAKIKVESRSIASALWKEIWEHLQF